MTRVRTMLTLGYWVLGNICRYWVVLLLGDIFFIVHDNHLDICDAAVVSR